MRLATWNVNSIRARLPRVLDWLDVWKPDLLCVQEIKVVDEAFPHDEFAERGYEVHSFGQKTYNGVALIGRAAPDEVTRALSSDPPEADRRVIAGRYGDLWIYNLYVPNGTELGSDRFSYKLEWYRRLRRTLEERHDPQDKVLLCGDFNVVPEDRDAHDPDRWRGRLLFTDEEVAALRSLQDWGLADAFRLKQEEGGHFTWWDYRAGAFHRGWGLRIDLILVTKPLETTVESVQIDRESRKGAKPSDHAAVIVDLA